jgi:hypothetical protein
MSLAFGHSEDVPVILTQGRGEGGLAQRFSAALRSLREGLPVILTRRRRVAEGAEKGGLAQRSLRLCE